MAAPLSTGCTGYLVEVDTSPVVYKCMTQAEYDSHTAAIHQHDAAVNHLYGSVLFVLAMIAVGFSIGLLIRWWVATRRRRH